MVLVRKSLNKREEHVVMKDLIYSNNVLELRTKLGISQEKMAKDLDISRRSISKIENGEQNASLEIGNRYGIGVLFEMSVYHAVAGSFFIAVVCHPVPPGLSSRPGLNHSLNAQRIFIVKNRLEHGLDFTFCIILIKNCQKSCKFKWIMRNLTERIVVFIVSGIIRFDVINLPLQIRFQALIGLSSSE